MIRSMYSNRNNLFYNNSSESFHGGSTIVSSRAHSPSVLLPWRIRIKVSRATEIKTSRASANPDNVLPLVNYSGPPRADSRGVKPTETIPSRYNKPADAHRVSWKWIDYSWLSVWLSTSASRLTLLSVTNETSFHELSSVCSPLKHARTMNNLII